MQTKPIYTGIVINLNVDTVTLPNGLTVDLEVVRHPGAAAVVPLKDDGKVVYKIEIIDTARKTRHVYVDAESGKIHTVK